MFLENVVFDSANPNVLGRFWESALGTENLTDEPACFETRLSVPGGPDLDLCFQAVAESAAEPRRLHLEFLGGAEQQPVVDRLLALGAVHADIGQGSVPWVVLADPEGNRFCVMEERAEFRDTGPLAALPLDVADPERDQEFWGWLTGWVPAPGSVLVLRHPSLRGPLLELCPERAPKAGTKNSVHLDVRLEPGDDFDALTREIRERGGSKLENDWGELPWTTFLDPSGNEFCLLPARG